MNKLENKFSLYEDNNVDIEVKNERLVRSLQDELSEYKTKTQNYIINFANVRTRRATARATGAGAP